MSNGSRTVPVAPLSVALLSWTLLWTSLRTLLRTSLPILLLASLLAGCGSSPFEPSDGPPARRIDPGSLRDAVPRKDPITRAGNTSPYTVLGKTYWVMTNPAGYNERGVASWYGSKFHGRPTANGEPYSLYEMTAAHRSLPIPCYVRVTNLENGKATIVRVNDRGPFHSERIIDLSYAAAVKLGFAEKGTALVEISLVDVDNGAAVADTSGAIQQTGSRHFLQAGAFQSRQSADDLRNRLASVTEHPVRVDTVTGPSTLYRVRIGPLPTRNAAEQLRGQLLAGPLREAQVISE